MSRRPPWLDEASADPIDDWPTRLAQLADAARQRQAERRVTRAEFTAARNAGLRARHAAKLARTRQAPPGTDNPQNSHNTPLAPVPRAPRAPARKPRSGEVDGMILGEKELAWQARVEGAAISYGWTVFEQMPAKRSQDQAVPSLILLRVDELLAVYLRLRIRADRMPPAAALAERIGERAVVWAPPMWMEIVTVLRGRA